MRINFYIFFGFIQSLAFAREIDFVIDLDNAFLFNDVREWSVEMREGRGVPPNMVIVASGKEYRAARGSPEFFQSLLNAKATLSFFSAHARPERNPDYLRQLHLPNGKSALEIAKNVVNKYSLIKTEIGSELQPPWPIFNGKKKKDIRIAIGKDDFTNSFLIDDDPGYVLAGQEKNFIFVANLSFDDEVTRVRGLIDLALEHSEKENRDLADVLFEIQWIEREGGDLVFNEERAATLDIYHRGERLLRNENPKFKLKSIESLPHEVPRDVPRLIELRPLEISQAAPKKKGLVTRAIQKVKGLCSWLLRRS